MTLGRTLCAWRLYRGTMVRRAEEVDEPAVLVTELNDEVEA